MGTPNKNLCFMQNVVPCKPLIAALGLLHLVVYNNTKYVSLGFGRKKMVALALLCGCDYGVGACGSSINTVVSFLHSVPENEVIPR